MQRLVPLILIAGLVSSCSKGLRSGADAARGGSTPDCAGAPPAACGYVCQAGVWVASGESCVAPDAALAGQPDARGTGQVTDAGGATGGGGVTGRGGVSATGGASVGGGATADSTTTGGVTAGGATASGGSASVGGANSGISGGSGGVSATGGVTTTGGRVYDAGASGGCADVSGTWHVSGSCMGPRATFNGSFVAVMTQTGCNLTFTLADDAGGSWTTTGRMEASGSGTLRGQFGFTDSSQCDLTLTTEGWDMACGSATQLCQLKGKKITT